MLSDDFLNILACPACKGRLTTDYETFLVCRPCGLKFPVREDIPVLLMDEAEKIAGQSVEVQKR